MVCVIVQDEIQKCRSILMDCRSEMYYQRLANYIKQIQLCQKNVGSSFLIIFIHKRAHLIDKINPKLLLISHDNYAQLYQVPYMLRNSLFV